MSTIIVPRRYSRIGMITGNLFLLNGVVSYFLNCKSVGILGFPLYLSTLSYWYEIRKESKIRYVDMFMAFTNISYVTYLSLFFFYEGNPWIRNILFGFFVYILNNFIFYYQVLSNPKNNQKNVALLLENRLSSYRYFSLAYTEPFTYKRHCAYRYSVMIHLVFLHALPTMTCMYCLIETERMKNKCLENEVF